MQSIPILGSTSKYFQKAWEIYNYSFPEYEKRGIENQKKLMKNKEYFFLAWSENKEVIGFTMHWEFEEFFIIEHIGVDKELRGSGFGSKIMQSFINESNKLIVLEVEFVKDEIQKRRVEFYERLGFKMNEYNYILPPIEEDKKPLPMPLMTYPNKIKSQEEFEKIRDIIHIKVYGRDKPLTHL